MTVADATWYEAPEGNAHAEVWTTVRRIEQEQGEIYDRLALLESLYDPYSPTGDQMNGNQRLANVTDNVVATNVDTTYASVATSEIRARYLTDGAPWKMQRRAKRLEYYTEGLGKQLGVHRKCRIGFKESSKVGAGLVKVYATRWNEPAVDHVRLRDVYVPDEDSRSGAPPLQLHHVDRNYDRDQLKAEYPDHADEIETANGARSSTSLNGYSSTSLFARRKVTVIESYRLPIGKRPKKGAKDKPGKAKYMPGRHTVTIENVTLLDEPWHKPHHPFAVCSWSERQGSFYPISGAERIAGHQNALNKRNWQIDRILDQNAMITTYVRPADGNLQVKTTKIGNVVAIKGDYPQAPVLPAVHPETYNSRRDLKQSAAEEFGQSQARQRGEIPAGLETGAAVREATAAQTQRFAPQEAEFEQFVLDTYFLLVDVCKDLGASAPTVVHTRWRKPIEWSEVDLGDVKVQISAASTLPRSAAGREQTILEWAQAGIISTDSVRRLIDNPDLDGEFSLYAAALDAIDTQIDEILDGGIATPEPFDNLKMIEWRGTATYNQIRFAGAPEEVIENLRDYISLAAWMSSQQLAQNDNAMPGMQSGMGPPAQADINGPPAGQAPAAALSSQAMQLRPTAAP